MRRKLVIAAIVLFEIAGALALWFRSLHCENRSDAWECGDTLYYALFTALWVVPLLAVAYDVAVKKRRSN